MTKIENPAAFDGAPTEQPVDLASQLNNSRFVEKNQSFKGKDGAASGSEQEEPIDGTALLDDLVTTFRRHLSLPVGAAEAMALWSVFTHCFDAVDVSPRLALISPLPGCGKSTALTVLRHLVCKPLAASNWSAATVFRSIERYRPTLLIDEADTLPPTATFIKGDVDHIHVIRGDFHIALKERAYAVPSQLAHEIAELEDDILTSARPEFGIVLCAADIIRGEKHHSEADVCGSGQLLRDGHAATRLLMQDNRFEANIADKPRYGFTWCLVVAVYDEDAIQVSRLCYRGGRAPHLVFCESGEVTVEWDTGLGGLRSSTRSSARSWPACLPTIPTKCPRSGACSR